MSQIKRRDSQHYEKMQKRRKAQLARVPGTIEYPTKSTSPGQKPLGQPKAPKSKTYRYSPVNFNGEPRR